MAGRCPFCAGAVDEQALVCPNCSRDIVIPETLRLEHLELLRKRDRLRAELAEVKARLSSRRRSAITGGRIAE